MLNVAFLKTAGSTLAGVHYVDLTSTNATPAYPNYTTAATNIQAAFPARQRGPARPNNRTLMTLPPGSQSGDVSPQSMVPPASLPVTSNRTRE